jgi:hypothetical protein
MHSVDSDQTKLFIVKLGARTTKQVVNNFFGDSGFRPNFTTPSPDNWLDSPIILGLNDPKIYLILRRDNETSNGGEEMETIAKTGWNSYLADALQISISRVLTEHLLQDRPMERAVVEALFQSKSREWATNFRLMKIIDPEEILPLIAALSHDNWWSRYDNAPSFSQQKIDAGIAVMSMRKAIRQALTDCGVDHFSEITPSIRVVADAIAQSFSIALEHSMEVLLEIDETCENTVNIPIQPPEILSVQTAAENTSTGDADTPADPMKAYAPGGKQSTGRDTRLI